MQLPAPLSLTTAADVPSERTTASATVAAIAASAAAIAAIAAIAAVAAVAAVAAAVLPQRQHMGTKDRLWLPPCFLALWCDQDLAPFCAGPFV